MTEIVKLEEQFAILREGELSKTPVRVLKRGDSFAVFDTRGDIVPAPASEHGLYHAGTRFLSRFELLLGRRQPLLLSSTISDDNVVFTADLTNPDVVKDGRVMLTRGTLHFFRSRLLANGSWIECLRIANHGLHPIEATLAFRFDADFADVFEVRGTRRPSRGWRLPDVAGADLVLSYRGLDGVERRTRIRCARTPDRVEEASLFFLIALEPHAWTQIEIDITCELGHETPPIRRFGDAVAELRQQVARDEERACVILSSNQALNRWIQRSAADLRMMVTDTLYGPYPYAGIPWFSTPFGRDGLITALELLWVAPHIARGVLTFLAETQATATDDAQDAQPGRILHEMRSGEMAALGEIPFGRYYGTADATPLFVMLAHAYFERTGDLSFLETLWPHIEAALDWIGEHGDCDGDGFVEYQRLSDVGLLHQGWKDSDDAIFHADGSSAEGPIALCEVQGYVYAARRAAAALAIALGHADRAVELEYQAEELRRRFEAVFWCEELSTYALALDGDKRPCRVRTSNAGLCLFAGIATPARARRVAGTLLGPESFSGWGVRTLGADE